MFFGALSQWGDIQGDNIEPIEEVFPKAPSRNLRRKIAIRSRDNARVDVYCVPAPNPLETLFLNESQKFSPKGRAQVSNFIEKYCAAIGGFEAAWFVFNGPGEGTRMGRWAIKGMARSKILPASPDDLSSLQECREEQMLKSFDRDCGTLRLGLKNRALQ
jgi:hypothetical protein